MFPVPNEILCSTSIPENRIRDEIVYLLPIPANSVRGHFIRQNDGDGPFDATGQPLDGYEKVVDELHKFVKPDFKFIMEGFFSPAGEFWITDVRAFGITYFDRVHYFLTALFGTQNRLKYIFKAPWYAVSDCPHLNSLVSVLRREGFEDFLLRFESDYSLDTDGNWVRLEIE